MINAYWVMLKATIWAVKVLPTFAPIMTPTDWARLMNPAEMNPTTRTVVTDDELSWRRLASQAGPNLPLFDVRLDEMEHPESGDVLSRLVLASVDWVNMVALTENGESVMVRQYRFGVRVARENRPLRRNSARGGAIAVRSRCWPWTATTSTFHT